MEKELEFRKMFRRHRFDKERYIIQEIQGIISPSCAVMISRMSCGAQR